MKKFLCVLICVLTVFSLVACSTPDAKEKNPSDQTLAAASESTPTQPTDQTSAPNDEDTTAIASILSFVEKYNETADGTVRVTQPTIEKQDDGSYVVSGTNGTILAVHLDPNGNVALVSPISDNISEKLSVAKTVVLLLHGTTLLPEEKQAIIDNTRATIDAISAEIDAAWEDAENTVLDTSLPDYSGLKAEAARISEEIQKLKDVIAGG